MGIDSLSDEALMKRVCEREAEAFRVLYVRYESRIFNFVLRHVDHPGLAEELLQETFWRVWQAARTFRADRAQFKTWLYKVALNATRSEMARKSHLLEQRLPAQDGVREQARFASQEAGPAERLEQTEMAGLLASALGALPAPYREVIGLKCIDGLKFSEIAAITGAPEGTLKARFHRGVAELKRRLIVREKKS